MFKFIMGMIVGALLYGQGPEIEKFFVDSGSVDVAIEKLQTFPPLGKVLTSGSLPRFPIRITLFTLPAIFFSL